MVGQRLRFLLTTAEEHPTYRADVRVLFGKYLPKFGIDTDLAAVVPMTGDVPPWGGGRLFPKPFKSNLGRMFAEIVQHLSLSWRCRQGYDGLIVRDKPIHGLIGLAAARMAGIPFVYWMSFPIPEMYLEIARSPDESVRWRRRLYAWIRGQAGSWALYRVLVPRVDHIFVQSAVMLNELRGKGLSHARVTAVPMGIDIEAMPIPPHHDPGESEGGTRRPSAVYLGTLSRLRRRELELMIDAAALVGESVPDFQLLVIGESDVEGEKGWLRRYAEDKGAAKWVRFVGWRPYDEGLALAGTCSIGLSPFPRGELHESASPTKAIEYLALGLPIVCNDQPDQAQVVRESGAGICVPLTAAAFGSAIEKLLDEPERARAMGRTGQAWVRANRNYSGLAALVAHTLRSLKHRGQGSRDAAI